MPLHINLLHEEQSKVVDRKRDPLKLGVLGLLVIAMIFYGYYLVKASGSRKIANEKAELEAQWARLEPQSIKAKAEETSANAAASASESVEKIINSRFYWGPLLSEITTNTGPELQITSFDGAVAQEAVTMKLTGIAAGREPRAVAEQFRQRLQEQLEKMHSPATAQFDVLENSDVPINLEGKSYPTANFSIGVQMSPQAKETMKKFNKDQVQKMVLSGIMFLILVYGYFQFLLGPLGRGDTANTAAIADLQTKLDGAKKQVRLGKNATERSASSLATMASIESMIPKEAAIAWLPPLVARFFAERGIPKAPLQLQNSEAVPGVGLEKFKYFTWELNLPPASFPVAASALSDLENEMPLLSVLHVRIDASPNTPEEQHMVCTIKSLLK